MKSMIENPSTFGQSIEQVLAWDFDRIIVSHGDILESDGHCLFYAAFKEFMNQSVTPQRSMSLGTFARCG